MEPMSDPEPHDLDGQADKQPGQQRARKVLGRPVDFVARLGRSYPGVTDFVARLERETQANNIFLVRGNDSTGRPAWYYLLVSPGRKAEFQQKASGGQIQLTDFGKIVISG